MATVKVQADKKSATASSTDFVKAGRKEKGLQEWLDKAVLAISKGEVTLTNMIENGRKELSRLRLLKIELQEARLMPVSDYRPLAMLYERQLAGVTPETLSAKGKLDAEKKKGQFLGDLTEEQERVIDRYYEVRAILEFQIVAQIRRVLELQGMLQPKPAKVAEVVEAA